MKRILLIPVVVALVFLASCGSSPLALQRSASQQDYGFVAPGVGGGAPMEAPAAEAPFAPESYAADSAASTGNGQAAQIERIVIKNADLTMVVADVEERMQAIQRMAEEMGGRLVSSNLYETYATNGAKVPEGTMVIRVPSEKLDEALGKIKADAVEVQNESVSGQDVTSEYVDLQSRLKNLEAAEAQLVKIMENASETEDVLNVFNQLTSIREQIEVIKGQIKYYDESASLSAVSIRLIAEETIQPIEIAGWKPGGVAAEAIQDLVYFFQDFVDFLIRFVLLILPVLVLIAIPVVLVFLGVRALVRWFRKPKTAEAQTEAKPKAKK